MAGKPLKTNRKIQKSLDRLSGFPNKHIRKRYLRSDICCPVCSTIEFGWRSTSDQCSECAIQEARKKSQIARILNISTRAGRVKKKRVKDEESQVSKS